MLTNGLSESLLLYNTSYLMLLVFIPLSILILFNLRYIKNAFSKINKKTWLFLIVIFLIGFWLRNSEYKYGIDVDGLFYHESAKTIYENNVFSQGCLIGTPADCKYFFNAVFLPGYPFLITPFFYIFGVHDIFSMILSGILGSLNIILIFFIFYLLFDNEKGSLYAASLYSLVPLDVYISSTAAVRTSALFFAFLSIIFFLISIKKNKLSLWLLTAISFSFSIYMKLELVFILIPFIFIFITNASGKNRKKYVLYIVIALLAFLVHQFFSINWLLNNGFGLTGGARTYSLSYVKFNLPVLLNSLFFKVRREYFFNPIVSLVFLMSIILFFYLARKDSFSSAYKKGFIFALIWFLVFLFAISLFYQCSEFPPSKCGGYKRYLQLLIAPYSIITALGFIFFSEHLKSYTKEHRTILVLFLIFLISFLTITPKFMVFNDGRLREDPVKNYYNLYSFLPENSIVITTQPQFFNMDIMRDKGLQAFVCYDSVFEDPEYRKIFLNELINADQDIFFIYDRVSCAQFLEISENFLYRIKNYPDGLYKINNTEEFKYKISEILNSSYS